MLPIIVEILFLFLLFSLQERTNEFLKALEMERQFTKDPIKSTLIQQMSETVVSQLNAINECLEELEVYFLETKKETRL